MSMLLRPSGSAAKGIPNTFLRKNRKWPHPPYKTKWDYILNQQQALQELRHLASSPPPLPSQQETQNPISPPYLLSCLINSFNTHNCEPTPIAYHFVLKTLIRGSRFSEVDSVLIHLENVEKFETPEWVFVDLIRAYGKKGMVREAMDLYFRIPKFRCVPTVSSLNSFLIMLCRKEELVGFVPRILLQSLDMNVRIDESSFSLLVKVLCRLRKVDYAIELLNCVIDEGFDLDCSLYSVVLSSLCKQKGVTSSQALLFLKEMKRIGFSPGELDFNNVIRFLVKQGKGMDALEVLSEMKMEGIKPHIASYNMVLYGLVEEGDFLRVEELFDEILLFGLMPNLCTYNVYIAGLCKQNKVNAGYKMICCMERSGCKPDAVTYNMVLEGFCKLGELSRIEQVWKEMKLKKLLNCEAYWIMVCSLIKRCKIAESCKFFEEMLTYGSVTTSAMIDEVIFMLCQGGFVLEALYMVEKLFTFAVFPGSRAWEALINGLKLNSNVITITYDQLGLHRDDSRVANMGCHLINE
ncbi:hypothetical protein Dimus_006926 [Dionaea muscipula]